MDKKEHFEAVSYGYSFGSKKVNMGPAFLNLNLICQCLAKAIMRHLQFSQGRYMFLEDLQKAQHCENVEFSYKFKNDLKIQRPQPEESKLLYEFVDKIKSDKKKQA
jgi:hypothetical protein